MTVPVAGSRGICSKVASDLLQGLVLLACTEQLRCKSQHYNHMQDPQVNMLCVHNSRDTAGVRHAPET
jgi:hypothetical protein